MPSPQRLFVLIALLLFICYSNTFDCAWQLDDNPNIIDNRPIQITSLSFDQLWQSIHAAPGSGRLVRPLAYLTLALNWYFGENDVFGYHVVNFLIHLGTALCLFITLQLLFQTPGLRQRYSGKEVFFITIMATILWAVNPIQIQAVTYIIQRMASLAALFSVLSLLCYLKARIKSAGKSRMLLFSAALLFYVFALLTKENIALLFLTVPVFEILFFQVRFSGKQLLRIGVALFLTACLCLLIGYLVRPEGLDFIFNYYNIRPFTMLERVLTEQRILLFYLSLIFFPAPNRLSIEHDIVLSTSLFSPWTTAAAVTVNILIIAIGLKVYRRQPLFTLAILFFYINHIIESTIVPLELIFEHRNYLPTIFIFLPIAQGLNFLLSKMQNNRGAIVCFYIALSLVIGSQGYATYRRNAVWKTEQSLWIDAMIKAPKSARPMAKLAIMLAWGDNPTKAKYRKALELTERTLAMRMSRSRLDAAQIANMASIYNKLGEYSKAVSYYEKALALAPQDANNRYNLINTLISNGDFKPARKEIETLLEQGYVHSDYFYLLGFIDLWLGDPSLALPSLRQALKLSPDRPDVLLAIGNCMSDLDYFDRARWFFNRAQTRGGEDIIVSFAMLQNALRQENISSGREIWSRMLARYPLPIILDKLQPSKARYRSVPLSIKILRPFIEKEISLLHPTPEP